MAMRTILLIASALIGAGTAAAFDEQAQMVLGKGRWGLVQGVLSDETVAEARKCTGTAIAFAFTANEIQRMTFENGQPPMAPPDFFADVTHSATRTSAEISLFETRGDPKPVVVYTYDPSVDTLMLMDGPDSGTHLYALCEVK